MKRRNSINAEEYLMKQWSVLSRNEYQEIQNSFKKTDQRDGGISFYDLIQILKSLGFKIDQQKKDAINAELTKKQIKIIDINTVLNQAASLKKQKNDYVNGQVQEKNEYLDAFVALGGSPDKTGFVKKAVLIEILKKQFQLTFDIESLVDGVVSGDLLDYDSFCQIFQKQKQAGQGRLASAASKSSLRSDESQRQLVLNDRQFQKFIMEHEVQHHAN